MEANNVLGTAGRFDTLHVKESAVPYQSSIGNTESRDDRKFRPIDPMNFSPIFAIVQKVSVADTLPHLVGMVLVLVTLVVLWGVCSLSATMIRILVPVAPTPAPASSPPPADDEICPEIVAVIAAAIASVTGSTHRIVAIKRGSSSWEKAGRQSVLSSHKIR